MNSKHDNYYIKKEYKPLKTAETFVQDANNYWTKKRIRKSSLYQYHVYQYAQNVIKDYKISSFADIGCGYPKKIKKFISPLLTEITLIDQPSMKCVVNRDFPQWNFIPIDLENVDYTNIGTFDLVICSDVIEHLLNPDSLISLIHQVTDENSFIVISTPERDIVRGINCTQSPHKEHVREWNLEEFNKYISNSGFRILDYKLLPQSRLSIIEDYIFKVFKYPKTARYSGNQMLVCKKFSD